MNLNAPRLAFSHLNLRFNPFGELNRIQRARVAVVDLEDLPQLLLTPGTALQFVADHGRGKSTHLIALHEQLPQCPYTQIHHGDRPKFSQQDIQFVDSIENLSRFARSRLYKRSRSIALTSHCDLSDELTKAGYLVVTRHITQQCPERIANLLNRRILFARRNPDLRVPLLTSETINRLMQECGTDIREMENRLYETFQIMKEIEDV